MNQATEKERVVDAVTALPDEATFADAIERLIFLSKIERGLRQRKAGEGAPQSEVEKRFAASWRK